jgi:hypothetical protein
MHVGVLVNCCFVTQILNYSWQCILCSRWFGCLLASRAETKALPCQRHDDSQGGERGIQIPYLPEVRYDILVIVGLVQVKCQ